MKNILFIPFGGFLFFTLLITIGTSVLAQEGFLGGSNHSTRNVKNDSLPDYMPRRSPDSKYLNVRSQVVYKNEYPLAPLGYSVGREPSKTAHKQFHPQRNRSRSGFGTILFAPGN
jgi:hypothetical protein